MITKINQIAGTLCITVLILLFPSHVCAFMLLGAEGTTHTLKGLQLTWSVSGKRQVLTCSMDYFGTARSFTVLIPLKGNVKKNEFRSINSIYANKLNQITAPQWIQFYDLPPCSENYSLESHLEWGGPAPDTLDAIGLNGRPPEVLIQPSRFSAGEFDFNIFDNSAELFNWSLKNKIKVSPEQALIIRKYPQNLYNLVCVNVKLESYIIRERVNIRPFQLVWESLELTLPTGIISSLSESGVMTELYFLHPDGKLLPQNHRMVQFLSEKTFPFRAKERFSELHRSVFEVAHLAEGRRTIFLTHFSDQGKKKAEKNKTDSLITNELLQNLGVIHLYYPNEDEYKGSLFITRMMFWAEKPYFDEDLTFFCTPSSSTFQIKYYSLQPSPGNTDCPAGRKYLNELKKKQKEENDNLLLYAGWGSIYETNTIRLMMDSESKKIIKD